MESARRQNSSVVERVLEYCRVCMSWRALKVSLFVVALGVGLYLVLMPFLPGVKFDIGRKLDWGDADLGVEGESTDEMPADNRLVIPSIGVDVEIVEGSGEEALNRGVWHRPGTGDPLVGGNFVVTGHRFRYLPPNNTTFYHLDRLEVGDGIVVYWEGEQYDYVVDEIFVVNPDDVEIEAVTVEYQLTLYTCTPLWTAQQRLVVVGVPANL